MTKRSFLIFLRAPVAWALSVVFILTSCREEEIIPAVPREDDLPKAVTNEANQYVNSWIAENMQYWYLWNDELPRKTDQNLDPESYFKSLLSEKDRFSWIQDNYADLLNSLQGISKEAGYEFALYREKEGSENVILQILYIKPDSPADAAGLKRGDLVSHINGLQLTTANYRTLLDAIKAPHTLKYRSPLNQTETLGDIKTVSLTTVEYTENPNYLHNVLDVDGKKVGYFVYNFFASGTDAQPGRYDAETDAIFADFKAKGITDLVLDLRFNSGGSESAARNLASLIGHGVNENSIFLKRQYNELVQQAILDDETLGSGYLVSHYQRESNNIGDQLSRGRVYILTSSRTASASELVINSLRPFMDVFLIGDTTYGKNVGSITLYEENDPKNRWGLQPIVVKVYNSQDESDYSTGFAPDVMQPDNNLFLYPLGDPNEALLALAIGQITGTATTTRQDHSNRRELEHSLDLKQRSFRLLMDESLPGIPHLNP